MRDPASGRALQTARFILEVDGVSLARFNEVSGLGMSLDVEAVEEGGNNEFVHQLPGRIRWSNLTMKRGIVTDSAFFDWVSSCSGDGYAAAGNRIVRHSGAVTALDERGTRAMSYRLLDLFPVRWSGPNFGADGGGMLTEELEVAHHGLSIEML